MFGPFIARLFSFVSLPIISYYITLEEFGTFTLFTILVMYLTPMITLGTEQYYLRTYNQEEGALVRNRLLGLYSVISIIISLAGVSYYILYSEEGLGNSLYFFACAVIVAAFTALQDIYTRTIRFHGLGQIYSLAIFLSQFCTFVITIILTMVFKSIMALIISTVLSAVFSMIINIILFNKNVKKLEKQSIKSKNVIKKSLKYSLPLLPSIFLWLLQSTIDRLIISTYLSSEVLGVFSVGLKFASITILFVNSFLVFWEPKLYNYYDKYKGDIEFENIVRKYKNFYGIFMQLVISGLFLVLPLLVATLSTSYREALYIIPLMILPIYIHGFNYFSGFGPQLTRKTTYSLYPLVVSITINLMLNLLFVNKLGLIGVILFSNTGILILLICNTLISNKLMTRNINISYDLFKILANNVIAVYFFITHNFLVSACSIILLIVVDLFFNRKDLKEYFEMGSTVIKNKLKK